MAGHTEQKSTERVQDSERFVERRLYIRNVFDHTISNYRFEKVARERQPDSAGDYGMAIDAAGPSLVDALLIEVNAYKRGFSEHHRSKMAVATAHIQN